MSESLALAEAHLNQLHALGNSDSHRPLFHMCGALEQIIEHCKDALATSIQEVDDYIEALDQIGELKDALEQSQIMIEAYQKRCASAFSNLEAAYVEIARLKQAEEEPSKIVRCLFNNLYYAIKGSGTHLDANGGQSFVVVLEEITDYAPRDIRLESTLRFQQDYVNV